MLKPTFGPAAVSYEIIGTLLNAKLTDLDQPCTTEDGKRGKLKKWSFEVYLHYFGVTEVSAPVKGVDIGTEMRWSVAKEKVKHSTKTFCCCPGDR